MHDLSSFAGHNIRFRFIFGANSSQPGGNWRLDDFLIEAEVKGWAVNSIDFLATTTGGPSVWTYNDVNIYMAFGADSQFASGGFWNTADMKLVAEDLTAAVAWPFGDSLWYSFDLDSTFFLPEDLNLLFKMTKHDPAEAGSDYNWGCRLSPMYSSRFASGSAPPTFLTREMYLPVMRLNTTSGVLETPATEFDRWDIPMDAQNQYSDFEAIYTAEILGSSSLTNWTHGGEGDDWEFGEPLFIPDIDPSMTHENGSNIAGTDLTVDGYYGDDYRYWLVSEPYAMPDSMLSSIVLRYYRCLRLAPLDLGFVYLAFTDTPTPPDSASLDWILVKTYSSVNQSYWDYEDVYVTSEFSDAHSDSKDYFFVRYILDSNGSDVLGGWNLDNVQFLGSGS